LASFRSRISPPMTLFSSFWGLSCCFFLNDSALKVPPDLFRSLSPRPFERLSVFAHPPVRRRWSHPLSSFPPFFDQSTDSVCFPFPLPVINPLLLTKRTVSSRVGGVVLFIHTPPPSLTGFFRVFFFPTFAYSTNVSYRTFRSKIPHVPFLLLHSAGCLFPFFPASPQFYTRYMSLHNSLLSVLFPLPPSSFCQFCWLQLPFLRFLLDFL